MRNLKDETLDYMSYRQKTVEDIDWVGGDDFSIPVDVFFELADTMYDSGFGAAEVAQDLKIVFKDGSAFVRREYDGSEYWKYVNFRKPDIERTDMVLTSRQMEEKYKNEDLWWIDTHSLLDLNFLGRLIRR